MDEKSGCYGSNLGCGYCPIAKATKALLQKASWLCFPHRYVYTCIYLEVVLIYYCLGQLLVQLEFDYDVHMCLFTVGGLLSPR